MKVIERKFYIADDGKEFENYDDCLKYECKTLEERFKEEFFLFDNKGNLLPLNSNSYAEAKYLLCKTEEASRALSHVIEESWGFEVPGKNLVGCWIFSDKLCYWSKADINNVQIIYNIMTKYGKEEL